MYGKLKVLVGCSLITVTPAAFAQYTINLTGVGNGTVADGVYVSPYQGTITGNGSGVEMWRGDRRSALTVAVPFV